MKMNNKKVGIIGAVVIGIIVILGGGLFISNQNAQKQDEAKMAMEETDMMKNEEEAMPKSDHKMEEGEKMMAADTNSNYVEYSRSVLENTNDKKRLLFFYASWCPICRPVDSALRNNANLVPEGIKVIRVNYNDPDTDQEEKDLAKKYGVTYQHTFVQIDKNGNALNKWSGGEIKDILNSLK